MANKKVKVFKVTWENTELTATVEAESKEVIYGMCGGFEFDQGGHGDMPLPLTVTEIIK